MMNRTGNMQIHLMYHDVYVCDTNESGFLRERDMPYKMSAARFEKQVKAVADHCMHFNLPKDHVVFTFDDGGKSFHSVIAPILEKYGYRGVFFISTRYIGSETFLSEDEIYDLHERGHLIGSHSHNHEHMDSLSDEVLDNEWQQSVKILSDIIKVPVIHASVPNGDISAAVLSGASRAGIMNLYTSEPTTEISSFEHMRVVGRYVMLNDSTPEYLISIISSPARRFFLSVRRHVIRMMKALLGFNYVKVKQLLFK